MKPETGKIPTLETGRLLMRPLSENDIDALYRISNEPLVRRYLWDDEPVLKARTWELVAQSERMFAEEGLGHFGLRLRGAEEFPAFARVSVARSAGLEPATFDS